MDDNKNNNINKDVKNSWNESDKYEEISKILRDDQNKENFNKKHSKFKRDEDNDKFNPFSDNAFTNIESVENDEDYTLNDDSFNNLYDEHVLKLDKVEHPVDLGLKNEIRDLSASINKMNDKIDNLETMIANLKQDIYQSKQQTETHEPWEDKKNPFTYNENFEKEFDTNQDLTEQFTDDNEVNSDIDEADSVESDYVEEQKVNDLIDNLAKEAIDVVNNDELLNKAEQESKPEENDNSDLLNKIQGNLNRFSFEEPVEIDGDDYVIAGEKVVFEDGTNKLKYKVRNVNTDETMTLEPYKINKK